MKIKCKKCGAEYGVFDLSINGNGDGKTFIACDNCGAYTIVNIPDLYHGWNPSKKNIIIMDCIDDIKESITSDADLILVWLTKEVVDDEGLYPFLRKDGELKPYLRKWGRIFNKSTCVDKEIDFSRCLKECGVSVNWDGYKTIS